MGGLLHSTPQIPIIPFRPELLNNIRYGVVANIAVSHTAAGGSIPPIGVYREIYFCVHFVLHINGRLLHFIPQIPIISFRPELLNNIRYGVVANIAVSHTAAGGSIPPIGVYREISFCTLRTQCVAFIISVCV
ncbi:hypothetical protein N7447_003463 [Penicillium robsamsonii]|uniref:uncharacterized protein n=1 Tax=Penicillium robsamsonii TaxID=1792511 RepID=UPI002549B39B|nr:uncharacterized protein N7447_003463 [Penicillium robsamsonii]KAJ5826700.1 hypothetical protein N7447_003463 [Penicillium robsamsonii]